MEKSSFFTSLNGDRKYKSSDFAEYFATFISNGVFPNPSTNLVITSNSDMTINVAAGFGWINGYMYHNTDNLTLTVAAADGVLGRVDRVVLRCDFVNREIKAYVKAGTFSQNPVAPSLTRNNDYYELCIAEINVAGGAAAINQASITDTRLNTEVCGIVTQTVNEINTTELYKKLEAYIDERGQDVKGWIDEATTRWEVEFISWFNTIKDILDGDIAGALAARIAKLEETVNNLELTSTKVMRPNGKTVEKSISDNETSILSLQNELGANKTTLESNINAIRVVL